MSICMSVSARTLLNHEYLLQYSDPKCQGLLYLLDLLETSTCLPQELTFRSCAENWVLFLVLHLQNRQREKEHVSKKEISLSCDQTVS